MTATSLIVELVLTGAIALAVLLLPAAVVYRGELTGFGIGGEAALAIVLGAGFLIGVVIDRCADTVLDWWLAVKRLRFATKRAIARQRDELRGARPVTDIFPEDWLRMQLLGHGSEHAVRYHDQLRVRIRIARTVVVLMPALVTSALAAFWVYGRDPRDAPLDPIVAFGTPCGQMAILAALVLFTRTPDRLRTGRPQDVPEEKALRGFMWKSPGSVWFGAQLAAVVALSCGIGERFSVIPVGVVASGTIVTGLGAHAWWRINQTFMQFIWDYSRTAFPHGLAAACCDPAKAHTA